MTTIEYRHIVDGTETATETSVDYGEALSAGRDVLELSREWSQTEVADLSDSAVAELGAAELDGASDYYSIWCSYHA